VPANWYNVPPIVAPAVGLAAAVTEPEPSATESVWLAVAPVPNARARTPDDAAALPIAIEEVLVAVAFTPTATAPRPDDTAAPPIAIESVSLAIAFSPIAYAEAPDAVAK